MKNYVYIFLLLTNALLSCNTPDTKSATTHGSNKYTQLAQASRLMGEWQNHFSEGVITESWEQLNDSSLAGKSLVIIGKDTVSSETIILQQKGTEVWYIPTVKEQNNGQAIPFLLTLSSSNQLIFENPEHDFPQKIVYTFMGNDSLVAEISGDRKGQKRAQLFPMKRIQ